MSNEEKLRALLAEAREWVELNGEAGCPADQCEQCAAADKMLQRIDAALAEPGQDYEALYRTNVRCECGDYDACLLTKQRDEARAEVERLQKALEEALDLAEEGWSYADDLYKTKWKYAERLAALRPPKEGP